MSPLDPRSPESLGFWVAELPENGQSFSCLSESPLSLIVGYHIRAACKHVNADETRHVMVVVYTELVGASSSFLGIRLMSFLLRVVRGIGTLPSMLSPQARPDTDLPSLPSLAWNLAQWSMPPLRH